MQEGNNPINLAEVVAWLEGVLKSVAAWLEDHAPELEPLARKAHHHFLFKEAGWLPHYTTPFANLKDEWSVSQLSEFLFAHYLENWPMVRGAPLSAIARRCKSTEKLKEPFPKR